MEKRQLTYLDAWANFYAYIRQPEKWAAIDRPGRDRIFKAHRRYLFKKPADLKYEGVKAILLQYAPDRYDFQEMIILKEP